MKSKLPFTVVLLGCSLLVAASADDSLTFNVPGVTPSTPAPASTPASAPAPAPTPTATPAAPKAKFTDQQLAEAYGWYMAAQMGLRQLEFSKEQVEALCRGLIGAVTGGQPSFDPKEVGPELEAFMGKKTEVYLTKLRNAQVAEGSAFFAKLKDNKNVVELPSGLRYEILKAGTGANPKVGQQVTIHYTGSLLNGQVFDSSVERGRPAEMVLDQGQIIPGMLEGVQKVGVGGKVKLYIPPSLAYGDQGNQAIPPGATLIFEVEVLGAKDAPKEAAPAAK
jgi:FKBP-type peptidyl-prolyl cis-trans isomerase